MSKPNAYKVIFSSIFFLLFVFSVLALLVSQFSNTFSQLFLILTRDERVYDDLVVFFYFVGIVMALGYLILSSWFEYDGSLQKLIAMIVCICLIFVVVLKLSGTKTLDSTIVGLINNDKLRYLGFFELIKINFNSIVVSTFFYIFFVFLPLILFGFRYSLNIKNKIGKYLDFFCPSINTCIVILFASGFQAYYDKNNTFLYFDFFMFCIGLGLFIRVFWVRKDLFGFYEYANTLLFILGVWVCLFCSNTITQAENYYNARMAFYVLGLLGWFGEWMYKSFKQEV